MEGRGRNIILIVVLIVLVAAAAGIGYLIYQSSQAPENAAADNNLVGCVIDNPSVTDSYLKIANEPRCAGLVIERFEKSVPAGSTSGACVGTSENRTTFNAVPGQTYYPEGGCGKCVQIDANDGNRPHGTAKYMGDCPTTEPPTTPPATSCGDNICQSGELCEEASPTLGSKACLPSDIGKAPTGAATPACTFSGANACKQLPPTTEPKQCGDSCSVTSECPTGHQCSNNICTLETCTIAGNCSDACTPTTTPNSQCGDGNMDTGEECGEPGLTCRAGEVCNADTCVCSPQTNEQKQCGETCNTSAECPNGHTCGVGGTCILNACAAGEACSTNGCTLINPGELPNTDLSGEDASAILLGLIVMMLGVVVYKTGLLQALAYKSLGNNSELSLFDYLRKQMRGKRDSHEKGVLDKFE